MYGNKWEPYDPPPAAPKTAATFAASGLEERIIIPSLKALIVAVPAGVLAGLLIGAFKIQVSIWYAMAITCVVVFLVVFWGTSSKGQWLIERIAGADLNGDGFIGQPLPPALPAPETIRVRLEADNGRQVDYIDLPASSDQLQTLARGVLAGRTFAEDVWAPGVFSKPAFCKLRDEMVNRGLARWKNANAHAQGVELTVAGRAILKKFAGESPTPPTE